MTKCPVYFWTFLNALDYNHLIFLQSDIRFQKYATTWMTNVKAECSTRVRYYNLFIQRLNREWLLVKELLKEKYSFDINESIYWTDMKCVACQWRRGRQLASKNQSRSPQEKLNKKKTSEAIELIPSVTSNLKRCPWRWFGCCYAEIFNCISRNIRPHSDYVPASELENWSISMNRIIARGMERCFFRRWYAKSWRLPGGLRISTVVWN